MSTTVDMSYNGPQVKLYRPPSGGGVPYEDWKDEASCDGLPVYLFELQEFDEVERGEQEKTIAMGLKICSGCPVRTACLANSNIHDRYWTTRGGQPPEGLFLDSVKPFRALKAQRKGFASGEGPRRQPKKYCKKGHDNWKLRNDGKRRCQTCQLETNKADWEKRKKKLAPPSESSPTSPR